MIRKRVNLTCDVLPYGIGDEDGSERDLFHMLYPWPRQENKYKGKLAIILLLKGFINIYGWKCILRSDHKPLQYIFGNNRLVSVMASARLQRWKLVLAAYSYTIQYNQEKNSVWLMG